MNPKPNWRRSKVDERKERLLEYFESRFNIKYKDLSDEDRFQAKLRELKISEIEQDNEDIPYGLIRLGLNNYQLSFEYGDKATLLLGGLLSGAEIELEFFEKSEQIQFTAMPNNHLYYKYYFKMKSNPIFNYNNVKFLYKDEEYEIYDVGQLGDFKTIYRESKRFRISIHTRDYIFDEIMKMYDIDIDNELFYNEDIESILRELKISAINNDSISK